MPKYQVLYPGEESVCSSAIVEYKDDEEAILRSRGLVENGTVSESIVVRCGYSQYDQRVIARVYRGQPKPTEYDTEVTVY